MSDPSFGPDDDEILNEARQDAKNFGTGFVRMHPDGHMERIPPDQIIMMTRPNTQEA